MSAKTKTSDETAISIFDPPDARIVLLDRQRFDKFYDDVKAETDKLDVDLTTETGRKRIASMAFKVARTKTAIDEAGKLLTAEWREKISVVDAVRRDIRDRLDALKAEVRAPLTAWEEAEEARLERVNQTLAGWRSWGAIDIDDTSESVGARLELISGEDIDSDEFGSHFDIAVALRAQTIAALTAGQARLIKEEADREELDRLRAEALARQERERFEREAAEARALAEAEALAEKLRAEQAETDRLEAVALAKRREAERAERDRLAHEAEVKAAEEAARVKAERLATEQREAVERAHAIALEAEKRRADEADRKRQAEADRIERERLAAEAETKRLADEQRARDKDRAHRGSVMGVAKAAMMALGADEDVAKKIVLAIVAGEIPNVTLRF